MARRRETAAEAEARLLGLLSRGDIDGFDRATARARRELELRELEELEEEDDDEDDGFFYDEEDDDEFRFDDAEHWPAPDSHSVERLGVSEQATDS
jgi:hypothetical protein